MRTCVRRGEFKECWFECVKDLEFVVNFLVLGFWVLGIFSGWARGSVGEDWNVKYIISTTWFGDVWGSLLRAFWGEECFAML